MSAPVQEQSENKRSAVGSSADFADVDPVELDRIFLRFTDDEIEERYRAEHLARALPIIRLSLLCGALLYAAFGLLDVYLVERNLEYVLLIRFVAGIGTLLLTLALTYHRLFLHYSQVLLTAAMLNCGLAIVAMIAITDPPASTTYYAGLIMVTIYACLLVHCRLIYAVCVSLTLLAAFLVVVIFINPLPEWALVSNLFFLVMGMGVGTFACYALEFGWRQRFSRFLALEHASNLAIELRNEAVNANNAKTEFLATMSHELRTPLNAILGFTDILKAGMYGPLGSPKYEDYASDIHDSAHHLLSIINDILEFSKTEGGMIELREQEINAADLAERSIRMVYQMAASKGVRIRLERPEWTPVIRVDRRLMQQAMVNLLSNAIKFTPSAGEVSVGISHAEGGACMISFIDTGIGIAPEDQERIFQPFTQVQSAFAREQGGAGLGLPLVRRIVEMHDGEITLTSRLGEGTRVDVTLPSDRTVGFAEFADHQSGEMRQAC